jgi:hypothetical protein
MKLILRSLAVLAIVAVFAGCAQPTKPAALGKASPVGSRFEGTGKVTLHPGQPCASQIMFDFRTASSNTVWLAAPMQETRILTDAADCQCRVHIWGKWQRGRQTGCSYVDVTKVVPWK